MQKRLKQQTEVKKPNQLSSQVAPKNFLEVRRQRKEWNEVKMSQKGAFIGLCMAWVSRRTILGRRVNPAYLEGPPVSIDQVNVDWLTRSNFQKKTKKSLFFSQSSATSLENVSKVVAANWFSQVKSGPNSWVVSTSNKIRNHVLHPTPFTALKMLDKEGAAVDTVFCSPTICVPSHKACWGYKSP